MIEQDLQREIMKIDRLQQLGSGMDAVKGAETIFTNNEGKPFHASVFDPDKGVVVFRKVDRTVVTAMKGGLLGAYREAVAEGNKGAADIIVKKHL